MKNFRSRFLGGAWAAILSGSLVGILIFAIAMIWRGARSETIVLQVTQVDDPNIVRIYVGGEVIKPGLYTLPRGSRVGDALHAAGGASAAGEIGSLRMANVVEDADQIIVPARLNTIAPTNSTPPSIVSGSATPAIATSQTGPININTASSGELEALPGIGPAYAVLIIEYRTANGPFQTVDELEVISGISPRMVDEMRHLITIGP